MAPHVPIKDYVEFDPSDIAFDIVLHEQSVSHLSLTNVSNVDVAYKVKTTSPRRYCVRPNSDILPVGTAIDIELVLQAFEAMPADIDDCRDKFQLLVAPLEEGVVAENVTDVWEAVPKSSVLQAKFRVKLTLHSDFPQVALSETHSFAETIREEDPPKSLPDGMYADGPSFGAPLASGVAAVGATTAVAAVGADAPQPPPAPPGPPSRPAPGAPRALEERRLMPADGSAKGEASRLPPRQPSPGGGGEPGKPKVVARVGAGQSPASLAALAAAPTVEERKVELGAAIEKSLEFPGADSPDLSDQVVLDDRKHELGEAVQRSNMQRSTLAKSEVPGYGDEGRAAESAAERSFAAAASHSGQREEAAIGVATATAAEGRKERARGERAAAATDGSAGNAGSSLTETAGGDLYATAAPAVDEDGLTAEEIAEIRARVLAGVAAPKVSVAELSEEAAQRAAVERAGQLMLISKAKDEEISVLSSQLAEARHKLEDAKMAVLPAYDVKYEVDENARIPAAQIAVMALLSGVVLNLLV